MEPATMAALANFAMQLFQSMQGGDDYSQQPTMTKRQGKLQDKLLNHLDQQLGPNGSFGKGMGILEQYLDPNSSIYKNFEEPYMNEFNQKTIPGIAEQYAGVGALSSSGFGQSLSAASGNLHSNLAAMKSGLQMNSIDKIFNQFNQMMDPAFKSRFGYQENGASGGNAALMSFTPNMFNGFGNSQGQNSSTPQQNFGGMQNARLTPTNYPIA